MRLAKRPAPLAVFARLAVLLAASLAVAPAAVEAAQARPVPALPAPATPPPGALAPSAPAERCANCHAAVAARRYLHQALAKNECTDCHRPSRTGSGKCLSRTSAAWALVKTEPELCYGCHKRLDQSKTVHTAVRQGSCLACHAPHSSDFPKLVRLPREKLCLECHELEPLLTKPVRHAPVAEGRCLDCHDPHGSNQPASVRTAGTASCMTCHDAKAPTGGGTPGAGFRVDLSKAVVHKVITQKNDCGVCHETGHSGDHLKLLKRSGSDLCYGCHDRQDKATYPHTAIIAGDCAVCHDPHSSDRPKLISAATSAGTCFTCHQDDLTGRKVIHKPLEKGCDQCHLAHGGPNRNLLKGGDGKKACYACHQTPVDSGKVKHAALERHGCTGCHDPHGSANRFLLARKTNDLCIGCHAEQKDGKHVTTISQRGHTVGGPTLNDPRKPDRPFSCASCHNPHGSDFPRFFYLGNTAMESCDGCHGDKSGKNPALKNITSRSRKPGAEPATGAAGGGAGGAGPGTGGGSGGSGSGGPGPGGSSSGDGSPPAR